jgi:hypothetical protein
VNESVGDEQDPVCFYCEQALTDPDDIEAGCHAYCRSAQQSRDEYDALPESEK